MCKILGLSLNRLAADDKYSLLNIDNVTEPIQMQLGKCLKILVSEELSTNMLNGVKHCLNLHSRSFNISVDQYGWHLVPKYLS